MRSRYAWTSCLIAIAWGSFSPRCAGAGLPCPGQGSAWPEIVVSPTEDVQKFITAVAVQDSGDFMVLLIRPTDTGWSDLRAQRFDICGRPLSKPSQVWKDHPAGYPCRVARGPDEGFLAAWSQDSCIWIRPYDRDGISLSDPICASGEDCDTRDPWYGDLFSVQLASDREGNYVAVWAVECVYLSETGGRCYNSFLVRRFDAEGHWLGQEFVAMPGEYPGYYDPPRRVPASCAPVGLATGPDGESVLATTGNNPEDRETHRIYAWLFDRDLGLRRMPILVTDVARPNWEGAVATDADGNFVIVWTVWADRHWQPPAPYTEQDKGQIFVQRFSRDGDRIGPRIQVCEWSGVRRLYFQMPRVAMDPDGKFLVVWTSGRWGIVLGQRFDAEGRRIGRTFQVNVRGWIDEGMGANVHLSMNDRGRYVVTYPLGPDPGPTTLCARLLDFSAREFIRGDANDDGRIDIGDPIGILMVLFGGGYLRGSIDAADVDDDGRIVIDDAVFLLMHLFTGEYPRLPHPWPLPGFDPTA